MLKRLFSRGHGETLEVAITKPSSGAVVPERPDIAGIVTESSVVVWVVVHPLKVADYWVQPRLTVGNDGSWRVKVYIGRPDRDHGEEFEIMAVANPRRRLHEGDILPYWPKAKARSNVIEVTRE
jgi:hypothetical protein